MKKHLTLYNHQHNLEFYHVTKNAMTSVIHKFPGGFDWVTSVNLPSDTKTFCILRDPVTRAYSSFLHLRRSFRTTTLKRLIRPRVCRIFANPDLIEGFGYYLDEIKLKGFFNSHNWPQKHFLNMPYNQESDRKERKVSDINYFLSFENLDDDLSRMIGSVISLETDNRSDSSQKELLVYASPQFEDEICKIYSMDVDFIDTKLTFS